MMANAQEPPTALSLTLEIEMIKMYCTLVREYLIICGKSVIYAHSIFGNALTCNIMIFSLYQVILLALSSLLLLQH